MAKSLRKPTYDELVECSNNEIGQHMKQLASQIDEARKQGESTSELAQVYRVYEDEWLKRQMLPWHAYK